jgi:Uma2 family endonuclease
MATTRVQIGPADVGRKMTLEEFREAEEQPGFRYELAGGVLEVTEVPDDPHGKVEDNLHEAISAYRRQSPGRIFRCGGASAFRLWVPGMTSGRNPDVAIVLEGTPKDARGRRPPSWVAEIVSEGGEERDYVTKRQEYLVFGIREYWIVDLRQRQVTVLNRREAPEGAMWAERVFRGDEPIASELLPGYAGVVSDLWCDVEDPDTEA